VFDPATMHIAMLVVAAVAFAAAAEAAPFRSNSYITYEKKGLPTIDAYGRNLGSISVFSFELSEQGDVVPHEPWVPDTAEMLAAQSDGRPVVTTIVNHIQAPPGRPTQVHNGVLVHQLLSDPVRRAEHIRQVVAVANLAHGVEIDYERMLAETRPHFTTFIRELRAALGPEKRIFLVLQPKTDNAIGDRGRAVDWRAVAPHVDYMRVMAYYYAWATSEHGPAVPMDQLRRLADYMLNDPQQSIPREKVGILLSLYGWDWPMPVGTRGLLVEHDQAMAIASQHGVTPIRDPIERTLHFRYPGADGVEHEIWVDDYESIRARIELLQSLGMPRIDLWHLNTGDVRLWEWAATEFIYDPPGGPVGSNPPPATDASSWGRIDVDGDGAGDVAVFRPSDATWRFDADENGVADLTLVYGQGSDRPVPADYDGDGVTDMAVYRPATTRWFLDTNRNGGTDVSVTFGASGEIPVPGDYDGDGRADLALFRPSDGRWHFDFDRNGIADLTLFYGVNGDVPVPADYDGNGTVDLAVYRRSTGRWFIDTNRNGGTDLMVTFGSTSEIPVPGDYDGDGRADLALFRPSDGRWRFDRDENGVAELTLTYGVNGDVPVPADYDGDGIADMAVYRRSTGRWFIDTNLNGGTDRAVTFGASTDVPLRPNGWVLDALGF
jgi:spore germination protein YaaH